MYNKAIFYAKLLKKIQLYPVISVIFKINFRCFEF